MKTRTYLVMPPEVLEELQQEARRQDRPLSWLFAKAWELAKDKIKTYRPKEVDHGTEH